MQEQTAHGKDGVAGAEEFSSDRSTELDGCESSSGSSSEESDSDDPPPFAAEETIMIFDWDDTLLPSTWLTERGLIRDEDPAPTATQRAMLGRLAGQVSRTLAVAKRHGKVVIVTNAEEGWIEASCRKFMPSLCQALEGVSTISARSSYEQQGVASPFEWKYLAFEHEIGKFCETLVADGRRNVISLGDSAHERDALIRVTERIWNCCTKSVKLVERPAVEQLFKQHRLMRGCFRHIVNHEGNLDLCINCARECSAVSA